MPLAAPISTRPVSSSALQLIRVPKDHEAPCATTSESDPLVTYYIKVIHVESRHYVLREPLPVRAYREDGLWVAENEEFNLHAYGHTFDEAFQMLDERFDVIYQRAVRSPDHALSDKMREVRDRMRSAVSSS